MSYKKLSARRHAVVVCLAGYDVDEGKSSHRFVPSPGICPVSQARLRLLWQGRWLAYICSCVRSKHNAQSPSC